MGNHLLYRPLYLASFPPPDTASRRQPAKFQLGVTPDINFNKKVFQQPS